MIPSVTPNAAATAASRQARSAATSRSERASSRPPNAATISALDQSRSPVITAGDTCPHIRPSSPDTTYTETMLLPTSAEGGTTRRWRPQLVAVLPARLQGALEAPPALAGRRNNRDRVTVTAVLPPIPTGTRAPRVRSPRPPRQRGPAGHALAGRCRTAAPRAGRQTARRPAAA